MIVPPGADACTQLGIMPRRAGPVVVAVCRGSASDTRSPRKRSQDMRKILPGLAAAFLAVTLLARESTGQTANLNAELLNDWTAQKALMMKIADAMPEGKFSYKSTPPQRDYGQQILHVAGGNLMYLRFFGSKAAAPTINRNATGKAEILKALADSFDYGATLIKEQTSQSM